MPFSKSIAEFADAVETARTKLNTVIARISELEQERFRLVKAQPHTEDIAEVFRRGFWDAMADFKKQFASHLKSNFVGEDGPAAAAAAPGRSSDILRIEAKKPDQNELISRSVKADQRPGLNVAVLSFLLRDDLAQDIPRLVRELCPEASNGMRAADRARALSEVDAKLAELQIERSALQEDLAAARRAVIR